MYTYCHLYFFISLNLIFNFDIRPVGRNKVPPFRNIIYASKRSFLWFERTAGKTCLKLASLFKQKPPLNGCNSAESALITYKPGPNISKFRLQTKTCHVFHISHHLLQDGFEIDAHLQKFYCQQLQFHQSALYATLQYVVVFDEIGHHSALPCDYCLYQLWITVSIYIYVCRSHSLFKSCKLNNLLHILFETFSSHLIIISDLKPRQWHSLLERSPASGRFGVQIPAASTDLSL